MDYEKEYKAALERASKLQETCDSHAVVGWMEYIFPKLKESEDERMVKFIKKQLFNIKKTITDNYELDTEFTKAIDWLEKQGDKKPCMIQWKGDNLKEVIGFTGKDKNFDKWFKSFEEYEKYVHGHNDIFKLFNEDGSHYEVPVGAWIVKTPDGRNVASKSVLKQKLSEKAEPKFHVGDWVVDNCGYVWKIEGTINQFYILEGIEGGESRPTIEWVDKTFHLWAIQDAKDGDVLDANGAPFIYKKHDKDYVYFYCGVNLAGEFIEANGIGTWNNNNKVYPPTKEQRDLLFQKMIEAGYEWDFEKKELKKIEHKSAEWRAEDEQNLNACLSYINDDGLCRWLKDAIHVRYDKPAECGEEDETYLDHIITAIKSYYTDDKGKENPWREELLRWLKSFKDRVQPKQELGEEDEVGLGDALWAIEQARTIAKDENDMGNLWYAEHFLKTLKDRYTWSEEDCNQIETIACHLDNIGNGTMAESLFNIMDKYKSYELHNTWKPSEEQLDALKQAKNCEGNYYHTNAMLESLYGDLKKLI